MKLLLIAQSARLLAQSAARAGFQVFAIDHFADSDTLDYCKQCIVVPSGVSGFDETRLIAAAQHLALSHPDLTLVYGSGIDSRPSLVEKLTRLFPLLGNRSETLRQIAEPRFFFALLSQLSIPYPETRFTSPDQPGVWLVKPCCGEGGRGVTRSVKACFDLPSCSRGGKDVGFCAKIQASDGKVYFQKFVQGEAYSLLFLANGMTIRPIGFNTQWTAAHDPSQAFLFAGAINRADLSNGQRLAVAGYATKLTAATGLVGLNSIDFMLDGGECRVLEINPRPSATMALYDEDYDQGLLALHVAACQGKLPAFTLNGVSGKSTGRMPETVAVRPYSGLRLNLKPSGLPSPWYVNPVRALYIIYTPTAFVIPDGFRWPKECADIPKAGTRMESGEPLCSLLVQGKNRQEAETLVKLLENEILGGLLH